MPRGASARRAICIVWLALPYYSGRATSGLRRRLWAVASSGLGCPRGVPAALLILFARRDEAISQAGLRCLTPP